MVRSFDIIHKYFEKNIEYQLIIGYNDLHKRKNIFRAGCDSPPAVQPASGLSTADSVKFRSRQYSLDERRCVVFIDCKRQSDPEYLFCDAGAFLFCYS